jgi:hypothetical protein
MKTLGRVFVAAAALCVYAVPVSAQDAWDIKDRMSFFVMPDGKVVRMTNPVGTRGHTELMKSGREVKAGTIFYMTGGKLYMAQDTKMPSGMMLMDAIRDDKF